MAKGWTFQSLIDGHMTVTAHCHNPKCHHSQKLDLAALAAKFGPDTPAMEWDLRPKLSCRKCGNTDAKLFGLTYVPDYDRVPRLAMNSPYRKAKDGA